LGVSNSLVNVHKSQSKDGLGIAGYYFHDGYHGKLVFKGFEPNASYLYQYDEFDGVSVASSVKGQTVYGLSSNASIKQVAFDETKPLSNDEDLYLHVKIFMEHHERANPIGQSYDASKVGLGLSHYGLVNILGKRYDNSPDHERQYAANDIAVTLDNSSLREGPLQKHVQRILRQQGVLVAGEKLDWE
jgi:hypothetical protein